MKITTKVFANRIRLIDKPRVLLLALLLSLAVTGENSFAQQSLISQISLLKQEVAALQSAVATLQNQNATLSSQVTALQCTVSALQTQTGASSTQLTALTASVSVLQTARADLSCMITAVGVGPNKDVIFNGCNVHVRNATGQTQAANGAGNLIIGYNEEADPAKARTGSHNLVIGPRHGYSSVAGLVAARDKYVDPSAIAPVLF
jgi:hypothetical protein